MSIQAKLGAVLLGGLLLSSSGCGVIQVGNRSGGAAQAGVTQTSAPVATETAMAPAPTASVTVAVVSIPAATAPAATAPATGTSESMPVPAATATLVDTPAASGNPLDALAKLAGAMNTVKSFRAHVTSVPANPNTESTMEWVLPDRFRVIASQGEFIRIANTYYIKLGPGKWISGTLDAQNKNVPMPPDPREQVIQMVTSGAATFSGPDMLGGRPMLVYQVKLPAPEGTFVTSFKLWVGATDGLPYQEVTTTKDGTKTTVVFYDYNADIQINPPA